MTIQIYNTMTLKKEEFQSLEPGHVKMYVCGPTVYDFLHVGNFRGAIFFNLVRNWLEKRGFKVTYVYNYTDVDDKIIKRANEEGVESKEIADKYIEEFRKDLSNLRLKPHDHNPRVTEFMEPIIEMIGQLVKNEKAYVADDGEVLYSVESFEEYGKLSHKNVDELQVGARVEVSDKKRNPLDFALWKPSKENEPAWESPWGPGRPGWHIECSVMSTELLGDSIDIHGGGIDLIFPHHENEIAQSEGATHKPFVKYWMHNNFINFGSEKMSKSLGNIITGRNFMETYHPEILKYMVLSAHYRSQSDFSSEVADTAVAGLARVYSSLALAEDALSQDVEAGTVPKKFQSVLDQATQGIEKGLDDDFNTPEMFAQIFGVIRSFNSRYRKGQTATPETMAMAQAFKSFVKDQADVSALMLEEPKEFLHFLDNMLLKQKGLERAEIDQLVEARTKAREGKDYAKSDEVRDKLKNLGIEVHDTPQGTSWEVQK